MQAVTKAEIIEHLLKTLELSKKEARDVLESFCTEICLALEKGRHVKLSGLGDFKLLYKKERPGYNPKTKEMIPVTARRVVTFRAVKKFKDRIEPNNEKDQE